MAKSRPKIRKAAASKAKPARRELQVVDIRQTEDPRHPQEQRIVYTGRTSAGVFITPDNAITVPAVWACLRYLSQTVAMLPWRAMRTIKGGSEIAEMHPINWMLHKRPSREWSSFQFRETLMHWALRFGNGYAEIERDTVGRPFALWPLHPDRVCPKRDPVTGELFFEIDGPTKGKIDIDAADIFHLRGFGDGPIGVNVMQYAAESIGWAKAAQIFGATFFGNGMNTNGIIVTKTKLQKPARDVLETKLDARHKGPRRANKPLILDQDAEFKETQISPDKGQFVMTMQHQIEEISRWFGVPPHKIAHLLRSTNNNIEHQSIEVVQDSIMPWARRLEDEADYKLFGQNRQGFFTKINMLGLLRGDVAARADYYDARFKTASISPNEIRALEDENSMGPDGDQYFVQAGVLPIDMAGQQVAPPAPAGGQNDNQPLEEDDDAMAARARFELVMG